jgi:hypothetical protein
MLCRSIVILTLTLPALGQNLVVHYKLDETSGTLVSDASGNGLDAQTMGGTSWMPGFLGGGLDLDDSKNGHIAALHDPLHDVAQLTIAAWINIDVHQNYDGVLTKGTTVSPYSLMLATPNDRFKFQANNFNPPNGTSGGIYESIGVLTMDQWHHIAVTFDGQEVRLYLDGALDSVYNASGVILGTTSEDLILGGDFPGGDEYFDGTLDDVRLYDGALSAGDIANLYSGGGSGPLGNNFCGPANLNSTNQSAVISAMGVDQAGGYPLELTAAQMPANQFGIFLVSMTQDYVPMSGGSQGNLCLGGQVGGFKQDVKNSGAVGTFALDVDTLVIPQPGGSVAIQPGETWNFQAWFRDKNPKRTSNFTDGISILFQ